MKQSFFSSGTLLVGCCFALFFLNPSDCLAQLFEETISPTQTQTEEAVDGKQIPTTDHFMMLSNTFEYGQDVIGLTELDALGSVVQRTIVWQPGPLFFHYHARSLEVVLTAGGAPAGYWITGSEEDGSGFKRLVLIQTDLGGFPICVRYLNNQLGGAIAFDEEGVSLERQANGDVIVVGRSDQRSTAGTPPTQRMILARFPPTCGPLIWSFRYNAPTGINLIPEESCNGVRTAALVPVIAVTGRTVNASGQARTFASCINAANGLEYWRQTYNSGGAKDEGLDIVQNPANQRYMIVGQSLSTANILNLWVLNVVGNNGNLAANTAAIYGTLPPGGGDLSGTDVCLSTAGNRAIIAGRGQFTNSAGLLADHAFMTRLPFTNCANLDWFQYYEASEPVATGSESVVPITAGGAAVAGYFMTTGGFPINSGWAVNGAHPIYTNTLGVHAISDCPTPPFFPVKTCVGTSTVMPRTKTAVPWIPGKLYWEILQYSIADCDGVPPPPADGIDDRSSSPTIDQPSWLKTWPNPIAAGQILNIHFTSAKEGPASLRLFDVVGKWMLEKTVLVENGRLTAEIETGKLAPGAYFLQVRTSEFIKTVKVLVE